MIGNDPFWRSYFSNGLNPTYDICKMLSWWWGGFLASWWLGGQKIQPKKCRLVVTGILDGGLNVDFFLHQLIYSLSWFTGVFYIPGGAGFLASTVWLVQTCLFVATFWPPFVWILTILNAVTCRQVFKHCPLLRWQFLPLFHCRMKINSHTIHVWYIYLHLL